MQELNQKRAPIYEALCEMKSERIVPFDVPGHKRGRGNKELTDFLGEKCLSVDVNSSRPLDNLCHPMTVIKEAEDLTAQAFGAANSFFMVNGTSSCVQAMIMSACKEGEKIILPRNVHRSVIHSLILSGAIPIYVNPEIHDKLGIPLGMSTQKVKEAILKHKEAKAVLINNPTYYGICSNLKEITDFAHQNGMMVLADEAHGTHLYFHEDLPLAAMHAGADMASVSMHKSGGSLTQSSILLLGENVNSDYVRQIINLTQTTSGSYLLMSSIDISRKKLALKGREIFEEVMEMTEYAREEINEIGGYYAYGKEITNGDTIFDFDTTKLSVNTLETGLAGIEVHDLLRDEYNVQVEFGDIGNILAYISIGDSYKNIERLISALAEIKRRFGRKDKKLLIDCEYINPEVCMTPKKAFYSEKISLPLAESAGKICAEFVTSYPPGIPLLAPGELITPEIVRYINYIKEKGCFITGTEDIQANFINVIKE